MLIVTPKPLRDKLGDEGCSALVRLLNHVIEEPKPLPEERTALLAQVPAALPVRGVVHLPDGEPAHDGTAECDRVCTAFKRRLQVMEHRIITWFAIAVVIETVWLVLVMHFL